MKSIVYTPEINIPNEIETISRLFDEGVDFLYLRKINISSAYWYAYIEQFPFGHESQMITADFQLLHDLKLGGFHFQQEIVKSLSEEDLKENLHLLHHSSKISSVTAHDFEELKKYDGVFKHVLISPLYNSISKKDYKSAWDLEELKRYIIQREQNDTLLFAQGGIDIDKIEDVRTIGLDGITLLGYLWNDAQEAISKFKHLNLG